MSLTFSELARAVHANARGQAKCPAHEDGVASLSISEKNGKLLIFCHAGCEPEQIVSALGMKLSDLSGDHHDEPEAVYQYRDEKYSLLFEVVKRRNADGSKKFAQRRANGEWGLQDVRRVLYRLPELIAPENAGKPVLVPEGEKDVESLRSRGFVATTNLGGAGKGKWRDEFSEALRGRDVVLLPDNDDVGREHMKAVAKSLAGIAASVRVVELPDLPDKGDVSDFLSKHTADEFSAIVWPPKKSMLMPVDEVTAAVGRLWRDGVQPGVTTGWPTVDRHYTVRKREFTVVTGIPGHGKTSWIDALIVNLARLHGWRCGLFSAENLPIERHVAGLIEKIQGEPFGRPTDQYRMSFDALEAGLVFVREHFRFIRPIDDGQTLAMILDAMRELVEIGIDAIVLDPWNEIDHAIPAGMTETDYVDASLRKMRRFARVNDIHLFIVVHPAKMKRDQHGNYPIPTLYDVSGCHDEQTEVLTMAGWLRHADVTLEHEVCCFDPVEEILRYEKPSKLWEFDHDGDMVRISSPSFDAMVTPNHRLVVKPSWTEKPSFADRYKGNGIGRPQRYAHDGKWAFIEAREIASELLMPWATPLVDRTEYSISDEELRIIGWYVSEGWASSGSIAFCQADGRLASVMHETLETSGFDFTAALHESARFNEKPMRTFRIRVRRDRRSKSFAKMVLAECGDRGCATKRLPLWTWELSTRQKEILFSALIEGDGSIRRGGFSYATTSERLADEVQRLSIEIGRMAGISFSPGALSHHHGRYQVNIGSKDRREITLCAARHVTRERYTGKVYCLTVPTGAYLVRRNGKVGIYGNSAHWRNKADNGIVIWRDVLDNTERKTHVHIQKVRFREVGNVGAVHLQYQPSTSRFTETFRDDQRDIRY